jgi:hypothetical protein
MACLYIKLIDVQSKSACNTLTVKRVQIYTHSRQTFLLPTDHYLTDLMSACACIHKKVINSLLKCPISIKHVT